MLQTPANPVAASMLTLYCMQSLFLNLLQSQIHFSLYRRLHPASRMSSETATSAQGQRDPPLPDRGDQQKWRGGPAWCATRAESLKGEGGGRWSELLEPGQMPAVAVTSLVLHRHARLPGPPKPSPTKVKPAWYTKREPRK